MKVGFDATSLTAAGKGMARAQEELLRAAAKAGLVESLDIFVSEHADQSKLPRRDSWRYHIVRTRPMIIWEQVLCPHAARRLGLDVVITLSERAALWGPPRVVYIYEHPRHRAARLRQVGASRRQRLVDALTLALLPLSLRRAGVLLAASKATAADLERIRPTRVVYSGVSERFTPSDAPRLHLLHIASDDPRDNSAVVVEAYARLADPRPPLVIAGPLDAARPELERRADALGVASSIDWAGFQSSEGLLRLYREAIAYVDPSLYEGFGLQAAEALACGTPVIASNTTSLPEVVGEGGILLDPNDVDGFAEAMRRVSEDAELAASLSVRALEQARRFTWERTVREVLDACAEAVHTDS